MSMLLNSSRLNQGMTRQTYFNIPKRNGGYSGQNVAYILQLIIWLILPYLLLTSNKVYSITTTHTHETDITRKLIETTDESNCLSKMYGST